MTSDSVSSQEKTIASAIQHHQAGNLDRAASLYREILAVEPDHFDALHLLGVIAQQQGQNGEAVELIRRAILRNPAAHTALNNLGLAYLRMADLDEARDCFDRAIGLQPNYVDAHTNLGVCLQALGQLELATAEFRSVVALQPQSAPAHNNLAGILHTQGKSGEAIEHYRTALGIDPNFAEAHFNLARTFETLGDTAQALGGYQEALLLKPELAEANLYLGSILQSQGMFEDAVASYAAAIASDPNFVEARWALAMSQLGLVFGIGDDPAEFRAAFSRALVELDAWFQGARLNDGYKAVGSQGPFYLAYQEVNNVEILSQYGALCTRLMAHWQQAQRLAPAPQRPDGKIHIGIVSAYFRDHSVWNAILKGLCRHIDRDRFALHLFYTGKVRDAETDFAKAHSTQFVQASAGLERLAKEIAMQGLAAIIYPEVGMDAMTMKLASTRLAPVQLAAWGHPETSGLPTIDYYLSAADFEPVDAQHNYSEQLIALPNLGCCYESLEVEPATLDLEAFGVDVSAPIFVCPGTPFKYSPDRDRLFVQIAQELGRCQFIFFDYDQQNLSEKLKERLQVAFEDAGLYLEEFVVFLPWLSRSQFYALLKRADVFLDTIGFSGFNTAMQAIECGLPIVTHRGHFMRGRFASAILRRMGLNELVASSDDDYVKLAIDLARSPDRHQLRERIETSRAVLFGDVAPIRALEDFLVDVCR